MNNSNCCSFLSKIIITAITLTLALATQAKVYKWTDENGKVHYSDKPIDGNSKHIKMSRQQTNTEIDLAKKRASKLIQYQDKTLSISNQENRDKLETERENEGKRTKTLKDCKESRRRILVYSRGRPVFTKDKNGVKTYKGYTDEQKNKMIAELQQSIKENCSD